MSEEWRGTKGTEGTRGTEVARWARRALPGIIILHFALCTLHCLGATVEGRFLDPKEVSAGIGPKFVPLQVFPASWGTNTVLGVSRSAVVDTNGFWSVWLHGGIYRTEFGAGGNLRSVRVLVPPDDTNTYNFNYVAGLATNLSSFEWTNFLGQVSWRVLPGTNVSFVTNHFGLGNETITISAATSGTNGGSGQTEWPVSAITNAGTAAYSNAAAFQGAFAFTLLPTWADTNNAAVVTNIVKALATNVVQQNHGVASAPFVTNSARGGYTNNGEEGPLFILGTNITVGDGNVNSNINSIVIGYGLLSSKDDSVRIGPQEASLMLLAKNGTAIYTNLSAFGATNVFYGGVGAAGFYGVGSGLTALNGSEIGSGTVADARLSGNVSLLGSSIDLGSSEASGTLAAGRFPALTGDVTTSAGGLATTIASLPAVSGALLTALNASALGSGTVPDGRFPGTLPAASGANLTGLNGSAIASGTVDDARLSGNVSLLGSAIDLSGAEATGTLAAGRFPALTGDVTSSAGSLTTTLKTSPTIVTPTIASLVNMTHTHLDAAGGGTLTVPAIVAPGFLITNRNANTWTNESRLVIALGPAANSGAYGLDLTNNATASSGNQEYSPFLHFSGNGWKTASTAGSQPVEFAMGVVPVQGSANPTAALIISNSVNNAAYVESIRILSGNPTITTDPSASLSIHAGSGQALYLGNNTATFGGNIRIDSTQLKVKNTYQIAFSSDTTSFGTANATLATNIANGGLEVNNGTGATLTNFTARSIIINGGVMWVSGSASPEAAITAPVGSFYSRTGGGAGTSFYVKESGSGNTGWVAK